MRRVLSVMLILGFAACAAADEHTVRRVLKAGGRERTYLLHVPPGLEAGKPAPLVLAFHGGGGNGAQFERFTRFSALADREKFLVAYPDALERNWNDGREAPGIRAQADEVDDVGFAVAVIDDAHAVHPVDADRVFATGASNGAIFSHTLAARHSDRIAAIAPVIGGLATPVAKAFRPERPVSVLVIQSTADPLVPYGGGPITLTFGFGSRERGEVIATAEAVAKWVEHDACAKPPRSEELADADPDDGTRVTRETYAGGRGGTEVVVLTVTGGGHTWPGGSQYLPERRIGKTCRDFDATEAIWDFFAKHPRKKE